MEEEVDLRDYINVLLKWKKLIIWITVLAMLAAGVMSYFVIKPVYQGSGDVFLPVVGEKQILSPEGNVVLPVVREKPILSPEAAKTLIESSSFLKPLSEEIGIPYSEVSSGINVSIIKNTNFIEVKFENSSREKISKFFDVLISLLNEQDKELYDNKIEAMQSELLILESQFNSLSEQEQIIFSKIKQIKNDNRAQAEYALEYSLLSSTYNSIVDRKMSTEQQIDDLKSQLKLSHNFIYLNSPVAPDVPIKPKKLFNIAVAGVAAFFFAILLAFFLEYWYETNKEKKKPA